MKKLLIYIPSYNRAKSLELQLDSIADSANRISFDVIINDNCSPDSDGYSKIREYCEKENFIYHRNSVNIGADANIFNGFLVGMDYEYLWILSDDDLLKKGSVDTVLDFLGGKMDVLFFTHSKRAEISLETWTQEDILEKNIYVSDGAGLISNVIYKIDFIKNSIPIGLQNIYTCFAHLSVLLHSFRGATAKIGRIGSENFFIPDTNLPPYSSAAYSKSYFGFVLLGETLEDRFKREFINKYASFWNLRHWSVKQKDSVAFPNVMYAKAYILKYAYLSNFVRAKLCFWKITTPVLLFIKKNTSSDFRKTLRSKIGIKF